MPDNHRESSSFHEAMRKSGPFLSLGTGLAAPIILLALLGRWLDRKWETEPWLLLAGCLLGIAVGFYNFFKIVLRKPPGGGPENPPEESIRNSERGPGEDG